MTSMMIELRVININIKESISFSGFRLQYEPTDGASNCLLYSVIYFIQLFLKYMFRKIDLKGIIKSMIYFITFRHFRQSL